MSIESKNKPEEAPSPELIEEFRVLAERLAGNYSLAIREKMLDAGLREERDFTEMSPQFNYPSPIGELQIAYSHNPIGHMQQPGVQASIVNLDEDYIVEFWVDGFVTKISDEYLKSRQYERSSGRGPAISGHDLKEIVATLKLLRPEDFTTWS